MHSRSCPTWITSSCAQRAALVLTIGIVWLLIDVRDTQAHSCIPDPSHAAYDEAFGKAEAVFAGKPIARYTLYPPYIDIDSLNLTLGYSWISLYLIKVNTIWKGPLHEYVYVGGGGYALGVKYLIYARRDTTIAVRCGGEPTPLSAAQEILDKLGKGEPPIAGSHAAYPWIWSDWITEEALLEEFGDCLRTLDMHSFPSSPAPASVAVFPPVPVPIEAPNLAAFCENTGMPDWLVLAVAGTAGGLVALLVGASGAIYTLRRRHGGT